MLKSKDYVFVLWSHGLDEMAATAFVTELREAGLLVKVVGVTSRQISGAHGLALIPDLTLDQALLLATQAICVVIPSGTGRRKHVNDDPRLRQFLERASSNQAHFVTSRQYKTGPLGLELPPSVEEKVIIYPETEDVINFARELAKSLSKRDA